MEDYPIKSCVPVNKEGIIRAIRNGTPLSLAPDLRRILSEVNIKDYYCEKFPDDDLGKRLKSMTFAEVFDSMNNREDFYEVTGAGDSLVRERLFAKLSRLTKLDYDYIYELWLTSE